MKTHDSCWRPSHHGWYSPELSAPNIFPLCTNEKCSERMILKYRGSQCEGNESTDKYQKVVSRNASKRWSLAKVCHYPRELLWRKCCINGCKVTYFLKLVVYCDTWIPLSGLLHKCVSITSKQWASKIIIMLMNSHITVGELLEVKFYVWSLSYQRKVVNCSSQRFCLWFKLKYFIIIAYTLLFSAFTWTRGGFWYRYGTYSIAVPRLWAYSSTSAPWIQEQLLPASCRRGWFPTQSRPPSTAATDTRSIFSWQSTSKTKVV
jgi:hypothetical protein